jgi:hypothetical protein
MLDRLRQRLVPTDGIERHVLTARLLGSPETVVDVGGITGHLASYLPRAAVTTVNVDEAAEVVVRPGPHPLPMASRSYAASTSLDTLEHVPRDDRGFFVSELLRVARTRVVLCCPLGSDVRYEIEAADNAWYRQLTGADHPWIGEHLAYGVPTLSELERLFAVDGCTPRYRFSGDVRVTSRQFRMAETSNCTRRPKDIARWIGHRLTHRPDLGLESTPSRFTNRVFVIVDLPDEVPGGGQYTAPP